MNLQEIVKEKVGLTVEEATLIFRIQNEPIKEVGVNGCQIEELGKVWLELIQHFNKQFPCRENSITITKIQEALMWQEERTKGFLLLPRLLLLPKDHRPHPDAT